MRFDSMHTQPVLLTRRVHGLGHPWAGPWAIHGPGHPWAHQAKTFWPVMVNNYRFIYQSTNPRET